MNVLSKPIKKSLDNIISDNLQQCIYYTKLIVIRRLIIDIVHFIEISCKSFYKKYIKGNVLFKSVIKDAKEKYSINDNNNFFGLKTNLIVFYFFLLEEFYYNWLSDFRTPEMYEEIYKQIIVFDKYFELNNEYHVFNKPSNLSDQIILIIRGKYAINVKFQVLYTLMCILPFIFPPNNEIEYSVNYLFDKYIINESVSRNVNYQFNVTYLHLCYNKIIWNIKRLSNTSDDLSFVNQPDYFKLKLFDFIFNYFVIFIAYNPYILKKYNPKIRSEYDKISKLINDSRYNKHECLKLVKRRYTLLNTNFD
jgi:hypothetical protein